MKQILSCLILTFAVVSCHKQGCFISPEKTVFELVNTVGENVIENGTLPFSDVIISEDAGNGTFIGMHYNLTNDNRISVEQFGWYNGTKKYRFFTPDTTFNLSVKSSKIDSSGCNSFRINEVKFLNITGSKENDFYKIIIQ